METKINTFIVYKKYLAMSMSYLGFHYYKFTDNSGKTIYTFERTPKFMDCFNRLLELKNNYGKY